MVWQIINGSSMQKEPPRDRLSRFNEIILSFSQRELRSDRCILVCWAVSPRKVYNINVAIYNKAAIAFRPSPPPRRPPADVAAPYPHHRRHQRQQHRGRLRSGVTPRMPNNPTFMRSNRTNPAAYQPQPHEGSVSVCAMSATVVVLTAVITVAVHRWNPI